MRAVNLMPRDIADSRARRSLLPVVVAIAAVVAVTAVLGVLGMQASASVDGHKADLALTEAALARLPKPTPQAASPDVSAERSNRITALQSALATRVPVDRLLTDLSYVVPDDVWLTGLTVTVPSDSAQGAPAPASGSSTVTIKGATYSQPAIARFLARLSTVPSLEGSRLTESARVESQSADTKTQPTKGKPKAVVTFTVTADLAGALRA